MLAVVIDDHDMQITDIIRGSDHIANTPKQALIYQAFGWKTPRFAHIPLVHNPEGGKISKRDNNQISLKHLREDGFIPEAIQNHLTRLGFSHGNDEFFTLSQAIEWFDLDKVRKSPAKMDIKKMESLNRKHKAKKESAAIRNRPRDLGQ